MKKFYVFLNLISIKLNRILRTLKMNIDQVMFLILLLIGFIIFLILLADSKKGL